MNRTVERKRSSCADLLLRKLMRVDSACSNCGMRRNILIFSDRLEPNVYISCRDCNRFG